MSRKIAKPLEHSVQLCCMAKKSTISAELRHYLSELGRKGGRNSAKSRMEKLTPEQRKQIARNAARARWQRKSEK